MSNVLKIRVVVVLLLGAITSMAQTNSTQPKGRTRENFNNNWRFILDSVNSYSDAGVNDASWRKLNLPHDWSIEGTFSKDHPATAGGGALPGGMGWYRKTFTLPATAK